MAAHPFRRIPQKQTFYIDIRCCVRDVAPLLDDGETVHFRIEGTDTETGTDRIVEGTLADIVVTGSDDGVDLRSIANYGGRVALLVETDDETVEVGGWAATVETVEAHRITVLAVE